MANRKIFLKKCFVLLLLIFSTEAKSQISYGNNPEAGKYIVLNGVKHYYEVYGKGTPILLIHGNFTATKGWAAQIDYFSKKYKVYSLESRGRGKSELGKDTLNFMQLAADAAAFIKEMKMDSVYVIGKSDGGIVAILLGIYYPDRIKRIVAFGANMWPDSTALYGNTVKSCHEERLLAEKMLAAKDTTKNWKVEQQRYRLDEFQPNISALELQKIKIPVLVMSCDRDVIKEEHTFFIYKNIPFSNLCILNNERHKVPRLDPDAFNTSVDRYFSQPYRNNGWRFED